MPDEPQIQVPAEVEQGVVLAEQIAADLQVTDDASLTAASEALVNLTRLAKEAEDARTFLVKPLNDHVRRINDAFKPRSSAIQAAIVKAKREIAAYHTRKREQEQEALRAAAEFVGASPEVTDIVASKPVSRQVATTSGQTVGTSRWDYEVEDVRKLAAAVASGAAPVGLLELNRGATRSLLNASISGRGTPPEIPGLRFFKEESVAVRQ